MIGVRGWRKEDRRQGTHPRETGYRGRETRSRAVRQGIEDGIQRTET